MRLKAVGVQLDLTQAIVFQFQTGAIKSCTSAELYGVKPTSFQFQTGAIKSEDGCGESGCGGGCFNSKLVRLKEDIRLHLAPLYVEFQFQTGAIKSIVVVSAGPRRLKVSIPNWCD